MNEILWDNGVLACGMLAVLHWWAGFWWTGCKLQVDNRQPTMWTTAGLAKEPWMEPGCNWTIFWLMLVLVLTLFGMTNWYQLDWIIVVYIALFAGAVCGHLYGTEDWIWKIGCQFCLWMEARVCSKIPCGECWMEIQPFHAKCWNTVFLKVESNKVFYASENFCIQTIRNAQEPPQQPALKCCYCQEEGSVLPHPKTPSTKTSQLEIHELSARLCNPSSWKMLRAMLCERLAMKLQINLMSMILYKCWSICSMATLLLTFFDFDFDYLTLILYAERRPI